MMDSQRDDTASQSRSRAPAAATQSPRRGAGSRVPPVWSIPNAKAEVYAMLREVQVPFVQSKTQSDTASFHLCIEY